MPKFIKSKKEKAPKTKQKKQKVVKPKQKRPKKAAPKLKIPKMPKFKAPKLPKVQAKNPLPKNKKILVLVVVALILAIVGAAAAIILLTMSKKDKKEDAPPEAPAYYFSKDEEISSITTVVGEREFKNLTVIPEETEAEKETKKKEKSEDSEESKEEKGKKDSDKKEDSSKEKESDKKKVNEETSDEKEDKKEPETEKSGAEESSGEDGGEETTEETTAEEAPIPDEVYQYLHIEDVSADLKAYRAYLENEKNFFDVTEKTPPVPEEADEEKDESKQIYTFTGPSVDDNSHLTIILETTEDSYTVTARKEDEGWNTYFRKLWDDQKKTIEEYLKKPKATTSIEQAEDTVRSQGEEKLGLPEPTEAYEFIAAPGLSKVDGTNYYRVRTYKKLEDDTLIYMGTYLFDYDTSQVSYKFDEITGEATPLQ